MKPFDLEKAKAGHPLVTRSGNIVTDFTHHPTCCATQYKCSAVIFGSIETFTEEGSFRARTFSGNDLFLAEKPKVKREGWVNVYLCQSEAGDCSIGYVWKTENQARANARGGLKATVRIEWEEDAE